MMFREREKSFDFYISLVCRPQHRIVANPEGREVAESILCVTPKSKQQRGNL